MGCVVFVLALLVPRLMMVAILLLTNWFSVAYETLLWPVLGFFFMPYTTLAYMGAMLSGGQVDGLWLILLILAILVDLGHVGQGGRIKRKRRVR